MICKRSTKAKVSRNFQRRASRLHLTAPIITGRCSHVQSRVKSLRTSRRRRRRHGYCGDHRPVRRAVGKPEPRHCRAERRQTLESKIIAKNRPLEWAQTTYVTRRPQEDIRSCQSPLGQMEEGESIGIRSYSAAWRKRGLICGTRDGGVCGTVGRTHSLSNEQQVADSTGTVPVVRCYIRAVSTSLVFGEGRHQQPGIVRDDAVHAKFGGAQHLPWVVHRPGDHPFTRSMDLLHQAI
jgi:hypothetical protein